MIRQYYRTIFGFEVLGIPVLPTLIGSFLLMSTMFMWYGSFFKEGFYFGMGITEADVTAQALGLWYPIGLVLSMSQGIGVAILLKWRNWPGVVRSAATAITAAVFFAATTFSYRLVILPDHSHELFYINTSGIVTAFTLAAVAISGLRPRVANNAKSMQPHEENQAT